MTEGPISPSNPPKTSSAPSESIDIRDSLKRITLHGLLKILGQLSVGSWVLITTIIGAIFIVGAKWGEYATGNGGSEAIRSSQSQEVEKLKEQLGTKVSEIQYLQNTNEVLAKEKEKFAAKIEHGRDAMQTIADQLAEQVAQNDNFKKQERKLQAEINSLTKTIATLKTDLTSHEARNAELSTEITDLKKTLKAVRSSNATFEKQLLTKRVQEMMSGLRNKRSYLMWVPEKFSGYSLYIDNTRYSLYKCLRSIEPYDFLVDSLEAQDESLPLSFTVRTEDSVLHQVEHLFVVEIAEGKHHILRQFSNLSSSDSKTADLKLGPREVQFIGIDYIDVVLNEGPNSKVLRTLNQGEVARKTSNVISRMADDIECLQEPLRGR